MPLLAQAPLRCRAYDGPAATVGDMVAELTRSRAAARTKVVNVDTTNSAFLFPSGRQRPGRGRTFFKSDGMIVNHRNAMQRIRWVGSRRA
jgi:hypothetical protein